MNNIKEKLKKYNQEHLLNFFDELKESERENLLNQINSIDFELMKNLFNGISKKKDFSNIEPMESFETKEEYEIIGLESVKSGEYAFISMAGGQATRLGFDGPKGAYILGNGINKSLFEIYCDKLKNIYDLSGVYIPWYIMTSYSNNEETVKFLEANNYFEYPKDKIKFFIQEELPMLDLKGKIIMDSKHNIKFGANGHGGAFSALDKYGLIKEMKNSGIKWIFIGGIDNPLLPVDKFDLIGFAIKNEFKAASKIIPKGYPDEKVGVFCKKNGKPSVIEYIEMTQEMNNLRDANGELVYKDTHIICNLFNIKVLEEVADKKLKYYSALKKSDYIDNFGNLITPEKENAYKFECFIFDAFSFLDGVGLLRGKREEIFAPIKNAEGVDSPKTASKLYLDYYKNN